MREKYIWRWTLVAIGVVIFGLVLLNRLPEGYQVAAGDFYQLNDARNISDRFFYLWFSQAHGGLFNQLFIGGPYYWLLSIFTSNGVSLAWTSAISTFVFLFCSFWSADQGLRILGLRSVRVRLAASFLYTFNLFTLTIFTYSWGYSPHMLLYIFSPLLIANFLAFLFDGEWPKLYWWAVWSVLSLASFSNVGFLLSLLLVEFGLFLATLLIKPVLPTLKRYLWLLVLQIVCVGPVLWPNFITQRSFVAHLTNAASIGGDVINNFIAGTSSSPLNAVRFVMDYWRFPYTTIDSTQNIISAWPAVWHYVAIMPCLVVLFYLYRRVQKRQPFQKFESVVLIVALGLIVLVTRIGWPFASFNRWFYTATSGLFRSPDKLFVLLPFFLVLLFAFALNRSKAIRNNLVYLLLAFCLLWQLVPWLSGGVRAKLLLPNPVNGNQTAVQIPRDYFKLQPIINSDSEPGSIVSLPYSVTGSINWSKYPAWHFEGADIIHQLFTRDYVSANSYDNPQYETQFTFKQINEERLDQSDLLIGLQKFGARYVIWHKDAPEFWINSSMHIKILLDALVRDGSLIIQQDSESLILYQLRSDLITPIITATGGQARAEYQKINPTKYVVQLKNVLQPVELVFRQSFDSQWRISGPIQASHQMYDQYSNVWTVSRDQLLSSGVDVTENPDGSVSGQLTLNYGPQKVFNLSIILSFALLMIAAVRLFHERR